ncbi:DUF6538 domain-containing protein [Pseudomonas sp. OV546]|uniref:DUF6538 domain-containing protein n=1 Tax=Pseudomonas sp. OV546 TaxID=1881063 RepID=UPI003531AF85
MPDVIRPLFAQREIRRSLQTRCKREALIRGRDILAQVQGLFTQAFQGSRPSVELLRGAWEAGGKRLACWASWLRQQQLLGVAMPLRLKSCGKRPQSPYRPPQLRLP